MQTLPVTTAADEVDWLDALPAIQRLLLTTDGTMTTALAACHGEKVAVRLLGQAIVTQAEAEAEAVLDLGAGDRMLSRRVLLFGRRSRIPFLYGRSQVALDRLSPEVQSELLTGEAPIGLVLRDHRLETFRVAVDMGVRPGEPEAAAHLGPGLLCFKTYAIISAGRPVMVVHEEFPATDLRDAGRRCWSR